MTRRRVDPNDLIQTESVCRTSSSTDRRAAGCATGERPEFVLFPWPTGAGGGAAGGGWAQWVAPGSTPYYIFAHRALSERIFSLIGVDVRHWIKFDMRRQQKRQPLDRPPPSTGGGASTMFRDLESNNCVLCDERCRPPNVLCVGCLVTPTQAANALVTRLRLVERRYNALVRHCLGCAGVRNSGTSGQANVAGHDPVDCRNLDCAQLYSRVKLSRQLAAAEEHVARGLPRVEGW